jgi:xanthine dehydrogenase accessory factor
VTGKDTCLAGSPTSSPPAAGQGTYTARGNVKELKSIVDASKAIEQRGVRAALATVVNVTGSAYRRPGARMLIAADGQTVGSVSGGCLERDVLNQAQRVLHWNTARVVSYDSNSEDDIVWESNLGCNGVVDILIEPLSHNGKPGLLTFLADCLEYRQVGVVATVFGVEDHLKAAIGDRLMMSERQSLIHDIGDKDLAEAICNDSRHALASGTPKVMMYEMSAGRAEVFIEVIHPPVPLVIFGGGQDAIPLVQFAKELGWHVTVVDPRPGYATRQRFPLADTLIVCRPEEVSEHITIHRGTVAVVMTHHYLHDVDLLKLLLPLPLRYLGLLGSKKRTQQLLHNVQRESVSPSQINLDLIHGPIGLDIGADTPEEIALAVAAEIQAVLAGRLGGMLRIRDGPLHEQNPAVDVITLSGTIQGAVSCGQAY